MSPLAALLLDWVLTAAWPLVGQRGTRFFSPALFSAGGMAVGLAVLLPWLLRGGRLSRVFSRDAGPPLFGVAFFAGTATLIYVSALSYTTPANAAIVAQVEVLYSALLCAFVLKEAIPRSQLLGSALVVAGTGLIMFHDLSSPRWKGDLMILATPWMYQVAHILTKRLPKDLDDLAVTGGRIIYGLLVLAPACLWSWGRPGSWSWEPEAMALLLVQGVVLSCVNFILWYRAIRNMDLAKATTIMLSYPALTLLFSWALGAEKIGAVQVAGLVLTFSGATWVSRLVLQAQRRVPARLQVPPEAATDI